MAGLWSSLTQQLWALDGTVSFIIIYVLVFIILMTGGAKLRWFSYCFYINYSALELSCFWNVLKWTGSLMSRLKLKVANTDAVIIKQQMQLKIHSSFRETVTKPLAENKSPLSNIFWQNVCRFYWTNTFHICPVFFLFSFGSVCFNDSTKLLPSVHNRSLYSQLWISSSSDARGRYDASSS